MTIKTRYTNFSLNIRSLTVNIVRKKLYHDIFLDMCLLFFYKISLYLKNVQMVVIDFFSKHRIWQGFGQLGCFISNNTQS